MSDVPIPPLDADGSIRIQPVGVIRSGVAKQQTGGFEEVESTIELNPGLDQLLQGIEDYSHVTVLYWLSEQRTAHALHRPQDNPNVPVVGMFACR